MTILLLFAPTLWAAAPIRIPDAVMKTMAKDNAPISNTDKELFKSSVRSAKSSIARDMLDTFYADAVDFQNERRYDEALELL